MNKQEIKKVLLDVAGNPSSGAVKAIADAQAEELAKKLNGETKKAPTPKETRVVEPEETR